MTGLSKVLADQRGQAEKYGGIQISPTITYDYYRDISRLVRKMTRLVNEKVVPVLKEYESSYSEKAIMNDSMYIKDDAFGTMLSAAFTSIQNEWAGLDKYAKAISTVRLTQGNKYHRKQFLSDFKQLAGVDVSKLISPASQIGGRLIDKGSFVSVQDAIKNNIGLITKMPTEHLAKLEKSLVKGITKGDDLFSLRKIIEKTDKEYKGRSRLIARDQMQKLNGVLTGVRQQEVGVNGYIWRTSKDENVRSSHDHNRNKRFQWMSPPPGTGHPGEDIQCRCTAEPDLSQFFSPTLNQEIAKQQAGRDGDNGRVPISRKRAKTIKPLEETIKKPVAAKIAKPTTKDLKAELAKQQELTKLAKQKSEATVAANIELEKKLKKAKAINAIRVEKEIAKVEKGIKFDKGETGILLDENGDVLWRQKGRKASVSFSESQLASMKGQTLTHNHPSGGPFSDADFGIYSRYDLKEIRATGKWYTYKLNGGNVAPEQISLLKRRINAVDKHAIKISDRYFNEALRDLDRGKSKITKLQIYEKANKKYFDAMFELQKIETEKFGMIYERTKNNGKR